MHVLGAAALAVALAATPVGATKYPLVQYGQALATSTAGKFDVVVTDSPLPISAKTIATAVYNDSIPLTGWASLDLATVNNYDDVVAAQAAGYLEGYMTMQRSWEILTNAWPNDSASWGDAVMGFVQDNIDYMEEMYKEKGKTSPFWYHTYLQWKFQEAQHTGYSAAAPANMSIGFFDYYADTLAGDMGDIASALPGPSGAAAAASRLSRRRRNPAFPSHCSSLVKVVGANPATAPEELFIGHTTWAGLETMTRIYKRYDFPWSTVPGGPTVPARGISFSSYPATSESGDDFYVLSSGLAVVETTTGINNNTLYDYLTPKSVFTWVRAMVANRLATDAESWVRLFLTENSGTYNNAWSVVDYNKFTPGQPLQDNTMWYVEQVPGPFSVGMDHTPWLRNESYWASYNLYWDPFLFALTNQTALVEEYGSAMTYDGSSRALIFKRDHHKIVDEPSMGRMLRYNDFPNDPEGGQGCTGGYTSGVNGIAARGDLTNQNATCIDYNTFGDEAGTDTKYTSYRLVSAGGLGAVCQSGPTHDQLPVFNWSTTAVNYVTHIGMPEVYDFDWVQFEFPKRH